METQGHSDHAEILRLRDKVHGLEAEARALSWRLDLQGRIISEFRKGLREVRKEVDGMVRADEIAEAVAVKVKTQMAERNQILTTWPRRIGAAAAGAIIVADALKGLVHL